MPSNLSFLDTNFPSFTDEDSTEKKINTIQDYLFMTVESLRYALSHLNEGNMEQSFVDSIVKGDGTIAEIKQIVAGHTASILLLTQAQSEQGESIASIEETVDQQSASITSLVQVTNGHTSSIASISQTVTDQAAQIAVVVQNGEVQAGVIVSAINNDSSVTIQANRVNLNGYVTFTNLSTEGQTTIHGGNISTNTLSVANLKCQGENITVKNAAGTAVGYLGYATGMSGGDVTNGMAMKYDSTHYVICTSAGVRLQSGSNSIWVTDSGTSIGQAVFG